jgi:hypothetical protein
MPTDAAGSLETHHQKPSISILAEKDIRSRTPEGYDKAEDQDEGE